MTKILVFESEPAFAWELRNELGRLGCTVQIVDDGNAGLQAAAADKPDLILLSIELPRMNGFSVCNKLKKDPQLKDVPLIIMSSESSDETFEQHRKLKTRAEDYVRKPIALGELVFHIRQLVPIEAVIEPDAIAIDDPIVFDDDIEDLAAPVPKAVPAAPAPSASQDNEIDDFLGGAFDRIMSDDEPKPAAPVVKQPASLLPDPPTIPAPPPPAAAQPPVILAPLPPPPPPPLRSSASVVPPRPNITTAPVTARSAPPPPRLSDAPPTAPSAGDAATIEHLRIENARLRTELDASRANVQAFESSSAEHSDEVIHLRHEVEELKAKLAIANASSPSSIARSAPSREFLELRESLNNKDKEISSLRDQLAAKDKEIVELRDSTLTLERDKTDFIERYGELERSSEETSLKLEKVKEERYVIGLRAESLEAQVAKLEAKVATQDADLAAQAATFEAETSARVDAVRAEAEARVAQLEAVVATLQKQCADLEQASESAQLASKETEARLASELEQVRAEHALQIESIQAKHADELRSLRESQAQEVDAAHETEIATLRQEHAAQIDQLKASHAEEIEAVRADKQQAIDALRAEHSTASEDKLRAVEERLAEREREFAAEWVRGAAELESMHNEALKKAEHDVAERVRTELVDYYDTKLRQLEATHATELEKFRSERDRAISDLEASKRSAVQELDRYVIGLGADLQDTRQKLEETEEQHEALKGEMVALKSELSSHRSHVERLEAELRVARAEAQTLTADKERFVAEAVASAARLARLRSHAEQDRLSLENAREALTQAALRLREIEDRFESED